MSTLQADPFLSGNFAPIDTEVEAHQLSIVGEIPPELEGMFVRNGPNPQFAPIGQYHWFDGDGMVHGVQLHQGTATYRNRYIQTFGYLQEKQAQQAIWSGIFEPPQPQLPGGPTKNTANTALVWHAGRLLATWEGGAPHALTLPELDTLGKFTFQDQLSSAMTAHPKIDPESGEMFFFGYAFAPPYLQYSIVSAAGELIRTEPIDLPVGVMMHDFAITENYVIFMDLPLTGRPERAAQGQPFLAFEADRPSRFGIVPKYGSNRDVRWFESPACYVFHVLNAYEDEKTIVLIACRKQSFGLSGEDSASQSSYLYEWRFDLDSNQIQERTLSPIACEFPRIHETYTGRKMRYGYASKTAPTPLPLFDGIVKFDFAGFEGQPVQDLHQLPAHQYCGEAVFAPRPQATAEDDGWLLTFVQDESTQQSELLILDAQAISAAPVARVQLPQRVPYGFHAGWFPQIQVQATHRSPE